MKVYSFIVLFFLSHSLYSQTDQRNYKHYISLTGGRSTHGTGDMKGVSENVSFGKYFRKKLSWSVGIGASSHDGSYGISSIQADGKIIDNSYRYTASGLQISGGVAYSFIRSKRNEFGFRASGFFRYQTSSYFDQLLIVTDQNSPIPYPALYIFNTSPQRTYSVGVAPDLFYNHSISKSLFLGASAGFQADTNGDVLTNLSILIGKRF